MLSNVEVTASLSLTKSPTMKSITFFSASNEIQFSENLSIIFAIHLNPVKADFTIYSIIHLLTLVTIKGVETIVDPINWLLFNLCLYFSTVQSKNIYVITTIV